MMRRIIILEGPDGAGKTTLARELEHAYGFRYIHLGPPPYAEGALVEYATQLWRASNYDGCTVIDRLHLGERIYGPILRGYDGLGEEGSILLNRMMNAYGATTLVCLPPIEVARENWKKKDDLVNDTVIYSKIYQGYKLQVERGNPEWDYTRLDYKTAAKILVSDAYTHLPIMPKGTIGSCTPNFLIVGEQANHRYLDVPFMSLSGSSHYLYGCLQDAGYHEHEMAFLNAKDLDGNLNDVFGISKQLGNPALILLGKIAVSSAGTDVSPIKTFQVFHPAYWKRFMASKRDEYVAKLAEVRKTVYANYRA